MRKLTKTQRLSYITMLAALAIVINLFESYFIPPIQFGIRFGLANIIALIAILLFGVRELLFVNILRVTLGSLLRGYIFGSSFWISFGGVILSTIVIIISAKFKTSTLFMSILSAIAHSFGQVLVVMLLYKQSGIISLLPLLTISSVLTGILTGTVAKECVKRVR